jgi:hypothetical protein
MSEVGGPRSDARCLENVTHATGNPFQLRMYRIPRMEQPVSATDPDLWESRDA